MRQLLAVALILAALTTTQAELNVEFNPTLLISAAASQDLHSDASTGEITLEKVEAGFELVVAEKLTGFVLVEHDEGNIALCEAFASYAFNDLLTLTAGQLANNCGDFTSEAIYDPLIIDYAETKEPAVQLDVTGKMLYGGLTVYNGMITENFSAFVPMLGININDVVDLKASARVELGKKNWVDYSLVAGVFPIEKLALRGELYLETMGKPEAEDDEGNISYAGKVFGYYGEADFYPSDKWTIFGRYDQIIDDIDADKKSGTQLIQAGAGYSIIDPLRFALSFGMHNSEIEDKSDWTPAISAEARFEL